MILIVNRARTFVDDGIRPLDALHLASAEGANADYLCTCDDQFLKKAKKRTDLRIKVISPVELVEELEL